MRHVLRPHVGRQAAHVRHGLPQPGARLRAAGRDRAARREKPANMFCFGKQKITTQVFMMAPRRNAMTSRSTSTDYMWEGEIE